MRTALECKIKMLQYEAFVSVPYRDGRNYSWAFGHNDTSLRPGMSITFEEGLRLFAGDLVSREERITKLLKRDIPQEQFDTMMMLHYQSGNIYMPACVHLINYKRIGTLKAMYPQCAYNEEGEWIEALSTRRKDEWEVFENKDYGDLTKPIKVFEWDPRLPENKGRKPMLRTLTEEDLQWLQS